MAESPAKLVVNVTPGKNEKVDNTIHLEEILDHLHKQTSGLSGSVADEYKESLTKVQQHAADLLSELRTLRSSAP
jgi:hypothetical protein